MAIEITSVRDGRSIIARLSRLLRAVFHPFIHGRHRGLFNTGIALILITLAAVTFTLVQSYRFYSRIIDTRLAGGYLTSRPGIYAAPRSFSVGQKVSRADLIASLRRAGYADARASDVWSGSYSVAGNVIFIRPNRTLALDAAAVQVTIDGNDRVTAMTGDDVRDRE